MMNSKTDKYKEYLDMNKFKHIPAISKYNFNYYIGIDNDLLFGKSDDDNTTEWWIIAGIDSYFLGESYCSTGDKLIRFVERCT